jgi:hypothetical protein
MKHNQIARFLKIDNRFNVGIGLFPIEETGYSLIYRIQPLFIISVIKEV